MNCFSNNKIVIFFSSENKNIIDKLTYISISKYLQENNERKIIFVNINDNKKINTILNHIYNNDVLLGLGNLMLQSNFKKIIKIFNKNKIILLLFKILSLSIYNEL